MGKTLFDKIWDDHVIHARDDGNVLLLIDRQMTHDLHARAFPDLQARGLELKEPARLFAVPDHSVPTTAKTVQDIPEGEMRDAVRSLEEFSESLGYHHFGMEDDRHGIVHVVGPEQGITLPGTILVCGDSHTSTHGALGCIAFGIGHTELKHVMVTQTLWQRRPRRMRVTVTGELGPWVTGKDVILAIIAQIGTAGGTGYAIEYAGRAIEGLSMEGRMTLCNMTIEAGARFGLIAPDDACIDYCRGLPFAPKGALWDQAEAYWRTLKTDADAQFDREVTLDGDAIEPMVTWGNSPQWGLPITGAVPDPANEPDPGRRAEIEGAIDYMGLEAGMALSDIDIDTVFIGTCTNGRIEDLRAAARVVRGRRARTRTLIVPGSGLVKKQAEAEGLDRVFLDAGMDWREPGCSMCVAMNGDMLQPGERAASTSNRNFKGRQGPGSRTHLVSPAMAAAAAVTGRLTDVRDLLDGDAA